MEYNFENKFVETDETIIFFDNYINIDSPKEKFVIISHLSADNLAYLQQATLPAKTFVSQNLFLLLQKLTKFELIANLNLDLKVLPYGFAVSVADSKITALNSDDGLWGSMALYLEHDHQKLGYVAKFDIHGIHKKRIKAWKKFFSQQKLDYLILGYQDRDDSDNYLSKTGQLKNIEKTLEQADSTQIYLEMTPFDPEQLVKIDDLAHRLDYQIKWLPGYAELISYFKQLDFKEGSPAATDKTLIQREAQAHIADDLTISSPLLAEDGKIDFMNNFAYPTEAELKEILKYIAAKHVYFV
ncbi:hypothetical protein GTO84_03665 [Ligilactobacillus salivarius]|uniref:Uncharacterized protein n=2 Tax=Ligilactobacillus salivarius TaxID=1624 RepID=C2EFS8_9LACO|nr:hypothetical protein [Ligilactobacillus salivarius]MCR4913770.1 hypothetical protein [Lactobacillus sp.]ATP36044.1 hypothetical protein CR249_07355 [Ligilactobacillus salivarius]ATP38109.1 hypothetical protein CR531_08225 [Ligilactobacillus salivarius]EEJ74831.1 hypothetical protein HMPREF0545_0500 [Ligilactobacillus salivarius DSM 20555 = ATCC 11741]KRM69994.1 hypothetical protein FC55_GL001563 [Ligilactobacillus salivarius DSM 20555 = ATCC 11741]